ncbi:MAG: hypothetical protein RLZZ536_896 [Planctomycetota bacterium]|jgi:glycosyltransferase involved in cell wall biosynthesis
MTTTTPPPPLVSVIVTCFNQARLITETLQSVARQTFQGFECIVVDDGSLDESASVIRAFVERDARFRLISQPNQGVAATRNTGFQQARGQLIQFLDGDDLLDPEKLQLQVQYLEEHPELNAVLCLHRFLDHRSGTFSRHRFEPVQQRPLRQLLEGWHAGVSIPVHSPLFRRSIWGPDELPYPVNYRGRCEDWVFLIQVALKRTEFGSIDRELCTYRVGCSNFTENVENACGAAIEAAMFISSLLPVEMRTEFIHGVCQRTLRRYVELKKSQILADSVSWRIGRVITGPVVALLRLASGLRRVR